MRIGISSYALALLTGICMMQFLTSLPDIRWITLFPLCLLLLMSRLPVKWVAISLAGFLWALLQAHLYFNAVLAESIAGDDFWIDGIITDIPERQGRVQRFNFRIAQGSLSGSPNTKNLRLSWYDSEHLLKAGEKWHLRVRLKPPHGFMNPGGFDYERWLYQQGIHATGYVRVHVNNKKHATASPLDINVYRQYLADLLSENNDRGFNDLMAALSVGDKSTFSDQHWQVLKLTGTSHLMAISGLHIGLVAGLVFWVTRRICALGLITRVSCIHWAAIVSLLAAFAYALFAGFAIPTQRALIMLSVVMGGVFFKRQIRPASGLSLALIAVILFDPVSVLSVGFWFSFLAVAVIAYSFSGRISLPGILVQWGRLQWVLAVALLPLSLLAFQQGSIIAPVANFLLVPWVSFLVVPLVLMAALVTPVSLSLANGLFDLADGALSLVWPVIEYLSELPIASWQTSQPEGLPVILSLFGIILMLAPKGLPFRLLGLIMLIPVLGPNQNRIDQGDFELTLLDVGQGLSVYIQTHQHNLVFDAGARFSPGFDIGDKVVVPFLKAMGMSKLDRLVISHGDNDHIGGAESILRQITVHQLTGQDIEDLDHDTKNNCQQGDSWQWDGVEFEFLHPDLLSNHQRRNNKACVLRISSRAGSLLITSDIEKVAEQRLVRDFSMKLKSDVLIVPHHGSKTSSTDQFISSVAPRYALVSAGYRNRFKHPKQAIIERYHRNNLSLLNTADLGAIKIDFNYANGLSFPQSYRKQSGFYWNQH
ncbi:MAG: DNA internalization-related competence protein ComEC/Rec2 [Gammaproteobacteria bacterium]|nr:DNA internalization-related competence protein ComEC/Rec2 [Gammaproteobacteria bacterium]